MISKLKKQEKGFTIIEVLIVLAIAGLIILIVFLAVPALQRNSRNTQRKNDASAIAAALNEYTNNNNGALPTAAQGTGVFINNAKTNLIPSTGVTYTIGTSAASTPPTALDTAVITTNKKCGSATASTSTGASARSTIIEYQVETGGNAVNQCVEI